MHAGTLVKRSLPCFHSLIMLLLLKVPHCRSASFLGQCIVNIASPVGHQRPVGGAPGPAGKKTCQVSTRFHGHGCMQSTVSQHASTLRLPAAPAAVVAVCLQVRQMGQQRLVNAQLLRELLLAEDMVLAASSAGPHSKGPQYLGIVM